MARANWEMVLANAEPLGKPVAVGKYCSILSTLAEGVGKPCTSHSTFLHHRPWGYFHLGKYLLHSDGTFQKATPTPAKLPSLSL